VEGNGHILSRILLKTRETEENHVMPCQDDQSLGQHYSS